MQKVSKKVQESRQERMRKNSENKAKRSKQSWNELGKSMQQSMEERQPGTAQEVYKLALNHQKKCASSWEINKKVCNESSNELGKEVEEGNRQ